MTPEQVAALGAVAKIIQGLQGWPSWALFAVLGLVVALGPWVAVLYLQWLWDKRAAAQEIKAAENLGELKDIAEAGWKAYADNVMLVQETQAVAKQAVALSEQLAEIIHLNTQVQTTLTETIKNNMFCPQVRRGVGKD